MDFTPNHGIVKWTTADPSSIVAESAAQADSIESALDTFGGTIDTIANLDAISTAGVGSLYFVTSPGTGISPMSFRAVSGLGAATVWVANETVVASSKTNLDNFISSVAATSDIRFRVGGQAVVTATGLDYRFTSSTGTISLSPGWYVLSTGNITTQSAITFDDLSGFDEYEIVLDLPASSVANVLSVQLRKNGVSDASANYDRQTVFGSATSASATSALAQTSWQTLGVGGRSDKLFTLKLFSLNSATRRTVGDVVTSEKDATANVGRTMTSLWHRLSTGADFNGVLFTTNTGTVTGSYVVKGFKY